MATLQVFWCTLGCHPLPLQSTSTSESEERLKLKWGHEFIHTLWPFWPGIPGIPAGPRVPFDEEMTERLEKDHINS